jgi:uncharacterized protein
VSRIVKKKALKAKSFLYKETRMTYHCALITGATSGIGEVFARQLPADTTLLLTGRNAAKLDELKNQLSTADRQVHVLAADLAQGHDRLRVAQWAQTHPVDLFINNAGFGFYGDVLSNTLENEENMTQVNVVATTYLARAVLPVLLKTAQNKGNRAGMIVVSSVAGFMPLPRFATYAATKAYNLHYAEALAEEVKHLPLDVMALCPGPTSTGFGAIAGMGKDFNAKGIPADEVVALALRHLGRRRICIPRLQNRIGTFLPRLFPRRFVAWIGGEVMRRNRPV